LCYRFVVADPLWTQADIDTLKAAVASGVLSVEYAGPPARRITYQSLEAMQKLLGQMVAEVQGAAGVRPSYKLAAFRKGR
jgi:hypothetical protein